MFAIALCVCIVCSGVFAFAKTPFYDDLENHWAADSIHSWSNSGIFHGYDGKFRPDAPITRGEFATVLQRIFCFDTLAQNTFEDLGDQYYTEPILCLNHQGILNGFERRIRPEDVITREEAGTMLSRALMLPAPEAFSTDFADQDDISDWAKPAMLSLVRQGFLQGYHGYLRPKEPISRAETVTLLDRGLLLADAALSQTKTDKICIINQDNLLLNDAHFTKDVFVTSNVKHLVLEGVAVSGTLYVMSPSKQAVTLKNCTVTKMLPRYNFSVYEENDSQEEVSSTEEAGGEASASHTGNTESPPSGEDDLSPEEDPAYFSDHSDDEAGDTMPEALKPTIQTTLEDHLLQRNSKKVFDVIALDDSGNKIACKVRCNGINIEPSWDDEQKTSFTLEFIDSGEYLVEITATDADGISQSKTCYITYEAADYGEPIGKAYVCIEAFTVGGGYIVPPQEIDVLEGVNCAYLLDSLLESHQLSYMSTGSLDGGFYLSAIQGIPDFTPTISSDLLSALTDAGFAVEPDSYTPHQLAEFDFTQGSGWMYSVNGIYPNVGFSEYYLQEGDVLRIQYTLAYGSDIGGTAGAGYSYAGDFFEIVNRNELIKIIANRGIETCQDYIDLIVKPNLTAEELDDLITQLQ